MRPEYGRHARALPRHGVVSRDRRHLPNRLKQGRKKRENDFIFGSFWFFLLVILTLTWHTTIAPTLSRRSAPLSRGGARVRRAHSGFQVAGSGRGMVGRVPQEDAHTARVLLAVRTWSAYTSLAEAYMFDRYKTPTLVNAGAISPPQRAARCRRSRFTSMGSTTSTPAGNPADQVGAKSIPPITSSPDNDSQSL